MTEHEKFVEWMDSNNCTYRMLADQMGMSYDGIYQAIKVRKYFSPEFKWRFQEAFGRDLADSIFGVQSHLAPTTVAEVA